MRFKLILDREPEIKEINLTKLKELKINVSSTFLQNTKRFFQLTPPLVKFGGFLS
jgi:hypothetical protein